MFPTGAEFLYLYISYFVLFLYLIYSFFTTKSKYYKINLVSYLLYTFFIIFIFLDENNFQGGGSLSVLFYGTLFILIQIMILLIVKSIKFIRNK
jgi:hypothetical protein